MKVKNIACIGAGFVGGPTMAVIALKCPEIRVTVLDSNEHKINLWNNTVDKLPVYEPGLAEIIEEVRDKNLFFSTDIKNTIDQAEMIFMAVNTPTKIEGEGKGYAADLSNIEKCAREISKYSNSDKIVIEKSTLPVRTAEKVKQILNQSNKKIHFEVLSNPEFLAEGTAINDLFKSDRVIIGGDNTKSGRVAIEKLKKIYQRWIPSNKILITNVWSSELSKLVSNAMLAQRISSINSISSICERTGADIIEISKAVGMDKRIGPEFLKPSIGFGGSCFKKDILNLVYIARTYDLNEVADYWEGVIQINKFQTDRVSDKVEEFLNGDLSKNTISILGWAFKKNTNDSRESASIQVALNTLIKGGSIRIYDPMVSIEKIYNDINTGLQNKNFSIAKINKLMSKVKAYKGIYNTIKDSNLLIVCTEWDEFKTMDWDEIYQLMKDPKTIIDGRNILNKEDLIKRGFKIYSIGQV
tara:strand:+ start:453 stop:1862 length:1410 start_codon:yes stop_codon:yes gene_type:complete